MLSTLWQSALNDSSGAKGKPFAQRYTLEQRKRKRIMLLQKCGREHEGEVVCIVVDKGKGEIKEWIKPSYIFAISKDMKLANLMIQLANSLKLESATGLYYYCKGRLLRPDTPIRNLESDVSPDDGFVYLTAAKQAAYG